MTLFWYALTHVPWVGFLGGQNRWKLIPLCFRDGTKMLLVSMEPEAQLPHVLFSTSHYKQVYSQFKLFSNAMLQDQVSQRSVNMVNILSQQCFSYFRRPEQTRTAQQIPQWASAF